VGEIIMRVQTFRSISLFALATYALAASADQTYHVTDLGILPNTYSSEGRAVNDSGVAVGVCNDYATYPDQGFYYSGGSMHSLIGFPGVQRTIAKAINSSGQIAGDADSGGVAHAFSYSNGVMQDLGTLGGDVSYANGINDSGWVVGESRLLNLPIPRAFIYRNGAMEDLGTLADSDPYTFSIAYDVNNVGQAVGVSDTSSGVGTHAFIWSNGVMTDLGVLGGNYSTAYSINDSGQVVGESQTTGGQYHAFSYSNGLMTDIGTLGGTRSSAYGVNASGAIVGISRKSNGGEVGFIYQNGVMSDLNTMFDATSPTTLLNEAWGISDTGYIVGSANVNGGWHAVLLTPNPVPEPASLTALGLGAFALLRKRRKA
jgi:probable HAF family extracellular repeat protein